MNKGLEFWASAHSDAQHPGSRNDCEHCQIMIREFGEMPSIEEIRNWRNSNPVKGYRKSKIARRLSKLVFESDSYRCRICGGWEDLCADHIIPESKGGKTEFLNLQTLCRSCNSRKGTKIL
jgi:hypothetical protein